MYRVKSTSSARRRAKRLALETGIPQSHILLESRASHDRQVSIGDVEWWYTTHKRCGRRRPIPEHQPGGTPVKEREKYPAIVAWGAMMHSYNYYIDDQVALAARDKAPRLAVFRKQSRWVTLKEVTGQPARQYFRQHHPELALEAWGEPT